MAQQPIKPRYTLEECYGVLAIHPKTFRAWLEEDNITPETSRADKRIKFLTAAQLERLAKLHDKPWPPVASDQEHEIIRPEAYKLLIEQIAQADQQARQIITLQAELREQIEATNTTFEQAKADQVALHSQLDALRRDFVAQLAEIQRKQNEQEKQTLEQLDTVLQSTKLLRSMLTEIETHQQEAKTRIDSLIMTAGRQQQEITAIQSEQQQMHFAQAEQEKQAQEQQKQLTSRLDALATTTTSQEQQIKEQADQIGQLIGRVEQQEQQLTKQVKEAQASMREQLQQTQKATKAEFQAALNILHREISEEVERRAQGIETEQARDMATISGQQEQQSKQLARIAEEARATAASNQSRNDSTAQEIKHLQEQLQAEQQARANLEKLVKQLLDAQKQQQSEIESQAPQEPAGQTASKRRGRPPKTKESGTGPSDLQA
jgi:hypothetical protein